MPVSVAKNIEQYLSCQNNDICRLGDFVPKSLLQLFCVASSTKLDYFYATLSPDHAGLLLHQRHIVDDENAELALAGHDIFKRCVNIANIRKHMSQLKTTL